MEILFFVLGVAVGITFVFFLGSILDGVEKQDSYEGGSTVSGGRGQYVPPPAEPPA